MARAGDSLNQSDIDNLFEPNSDSNRFDITHKLVLSIAVPMSFGYLTTPILSLVDTAVIGQLGVAALIGGLAVGTNLVNIAFFTFNFLRAGTVGLTAQAFGGGDQIEIQAALLRALGLAAIIGMFLIVLSPLLLWIGLWFMAPGEASANATAVYFQVRMISAPFALANYVFFGWFVGRNSINIALLLQVLLNITNIFLSIFFVLGLNWGIAGVAMATVIAEILATLTGLVIARRVLRGESKPTWKQLYDSVALKRMMSMNGDIMIRSFALLFAFGYFTAQSARFGDVILAANAILLHFMFVGAYFLDGLAVAAEQISGRAIGARDRIAFVRSAKLTMLWSLVVATFLVVLYLATGNFIIDYITTSEEVREMAKTYFWWAAFISLAGAGAFIMDGIYIGSTWSREMSITMLASVAGFVVCWWITAPYLGNDGLWLSLYVFLILRGVTMAVRLPRNIRRSF